MLADQWNMIEKLPFDMGFAPYLPTKGSIPYLSEPAREIVGRVGETEVEQDFNQQCWQDSMYFSGKALGKFAMLLYALNDMALRPDLVAKGLPKLKSAIQLFIDNKQRNPLVFDECWKGGNMSSIRGDIA